MYSSRSITHVVLQINRCCQQEVECCLLHISNLSGNRCGDGWSKAAAVSASRIVVVEIVLLYLVTECLWKQVEEHYYIRLLYYLCTPDRLLSEYHIHRRDSRFILFQIYML